MENIDRNENNKNNENDKNNHFTEVKCKTRIIRKKNRPPVFRITFGEPMAPDEINNMFLKIPYTIRKE